MKSVFNHFAGIKKPPEIISRGEWGRFSKYITGTVHAGDSIFMKNTLQFIEGNREFKEPDPEEILSMIRNVLPIFSHPAT